MARFRFRAAGLAVLLAAGCLAGTSAQPRGRALGLANAGLLLEAGTWRVVVDFPFSGDFPWAVSPAPAQVAALLEARAPFGRVDAFLFTHDHVDHFDPALVAKALKAHPRAALVGTSKVLARVREAAGAGLANPLHEAQAGVPIALGGLFVTPLRAPHAAYWDIDPVSGQRVTRADGYIHTAYLADLGGVRFLLGGDAHEIETTPATRADMLLLDRTLWRAPGLEGLLARHRALGADRTVLMHVGPSDQAFFERAARPEASWLTVFTARNQAALLPPAGDVLMGQALPGSTPERFQPGRVSTAAHDFVVRFTPGLDELLVMRSSLDWHTGILRYVQKEGAWSGPRLLDLPFEGAVSYPFLSPDGDLLVFDGAKEPGAPDLWLSRRGEKGWSEPANPGPHVNSPAVEMHASMAANGNLYFSSNRPGGLGGFDLYRCTKTPEGYAPAENLGPAVNTAEFEAHPFIAPDESYLLFDARRKDGRGSNDLYASFRRPDGSWSPAVPLGPAVNTAAGEMRPYVPPGGRVLFFCSDRADGDPSARPRDLEAFRRRVEGAGNGSQDIWWVDLSVLEEARRRALNP